MRVIFEEAAPLQVSGSEIECEMKYGGHSHRPKLQKLTEVDSTTALSTSASALRADNRHALASTAVERVEQRAGDELGGAAWWSAPPMVESVPCAANGPISR